MAYRGAIFNNKGCPMVPGKLYANKSRDEIVISLLRNLRDKQTDILAYRGAVCCRMGSPRVHCILERLHAKNQGINKEMRKISL